MTDYEEITLPNQPMDVLKKTRKPRVKKDTKIEKGPEVAGIPEDTSLKQEMALFKARKLAKEQAKLEPEKELKELKEKDTERNARLSESRKKQQQPKGRIMKLLKQRQRFWILLYRRSNQRN